MSTDQFFMYGYWQPATRTWSGKWSNDKLMQSPQQFEFSFQPKQDTPVTPKNSCEKCMRAITDKEQFFVCLSCDRNAVHVGCWSPNTAWTCNTCTDISKRFGQLPPVFKYWVGFFEMATDQGLQRYDDTMRLEFNFLHKSDRESVVAGVAGKGHNAYGSFTLKGYLTRTKRDFGTDTFEIKIVRMYDAQMPLQSTPTITTNAPPAMLATSGMNSSAAYQNIGMPSSGMPQNAVQSSTGGMPESQPGGVSSSNAPLNVPRGRRRLEDDFDDGALDDANRKRLRGGGAGRSGHRSAILVTSSGVEGNIAPLIEVWRAVNMISDPSLGLVCLSAPSSNLPLRAIMRVHQTNEQISFILRSSSAMAACSSACIAVDNAMEFRTAAMSCASLDRKSQSAMPTAVAAAYAVETYGKPVCVIDMCPHPTYLASYLSNQPGVYVAVATRDGHDTRAWRESVGAAVSAVRAQRCELVMVSMILGEYDAAEYGAMVEILTSLAVPIVLIVEDVSLPRADKCAKILMEGLVRKFAGDSQAYPPQTGFVGSSSSYSNKPLASQGLYPNMALSSSQQVKAQLPPHVQPSKPVSGPLMDKNKSMAAGVPPTQSSSSSGNGMGQYIGSIKQPSVAPPHSMGGGAPSMPPVVPRQNSGMSIPVTSIPPPQPSLAITKNSKQANGMPSSGGQVGTAQMPMSYPSQGHQMGMAFRNGGAAMPPGQGSSQGGYAGQQASTMHAKQGIPVGSSTLAGQSGSVTTGSSANIKKAASSDSARQGSPLRQTSMGGGYGNQPILKQEYYEMPPEAFEPLPFTRDSGSIDVSSKDQQKSTQQIGSSKINSNGSMQNAPQSVPPIPVAPTNISANISLPPPSMDHQDSWDSGSDSPRATNSNKYDYITAGFKG